MSPVHEKGSFGGQETDIRTSIHRYGLFGGCDGRFETNIDVFGVYIKVSVSEARICKGV